MTARQTMGTPALATAASTLLPFDVPGDADASDPVLLINPAASDGSLLSACASRAHRLERMLEAWSCVTDREVAACELAFILRAGAVEVTLLLAEMERRARAARGAAA